MSKHVTLNGTATTTEQVSNKVFYGIMLIKNDDATNDLIVNFDANTSSDNTVVLKAGESIEDWNIVVGSIYYKSSAGNVKFRIIGKDSAY